MGHTAAPPAPALAEGHEPLAGNLCWLLSQASYVLTTEMTAALEGLGVSPRAHSVLATAMTGQHTQTELAAIVGLDKTTLVVTLDELEAAGLAERQPSSTDRRVRVIAVTKAGEKKVRQAQQITDQIRDDVLAALPPAQGAALLDALTSLVSDRLSEPAICAQAVRRRESRPGG